jgi:hypothetical protein
MNQKVWTVNVVLSEEGDLTRADAVLDGGAADEVRGFGRAKRAPNDPSVPLIGDELATARALSDLAHRLLETAASRIEAFEGHPVNVHD